ncbi:TauD/TfdA family dioxygenase [Streptomyces sp. SL13]|uniref:TauD/TfdA family dioxygenase n=1 Tax=Streptantibioticus silvisoli TaxID=2705255 RepID=A0AA90GWF2_9ACTN|nr:TauD/TfdA family dioxygenase [Streptantibioticus silvisoli]MDI5969348.1 TauD/TfdA family dioxygenase [Streptantibioticus silvisoli]
MSILPNADPGASRGPDQEPWLHELTVSEAAEIDEAFATLLASGKSDFAAGAAEFPLPRVGPKLRRILRSMEDEPGFALVRGIPVAGKSEEEVRRLYWGLGIHLGVPLIQNNSDSHMVDIRDEGRAGRLRVHSSNQHIGFHIDSTDIVGLLCRRAAARGGTSLVVSAEAVRREMSWVCPDLLPALYEPLPFADVASPDEHHPDFFLCPVFGRHEGRTTARFYLRRILRSQDNPAAPRLTDRQRRAVEAVEEIAARPDLVTAMEFQPGDLQLINNHMVLHGRTRFDSEEADTGRHLLRMWWSVPSSRLLPPEFEAAWGTRQPGTLRGAARRWQLHGEFGEFQRRQADAFGVVIPA